ncbi:hypothetical protein FFLO_02404 [Filobasidium floriforme]|uniref:Uncharacterized protein n=1 Tax=Filobasidium floriforme TaxID=5210 RepID=A0A8K0JNX5_9TREE|nr:uncharacterized protein HD553DRAFT_324950 [Filobasidium floriforme]KAG7562122.1 hypothetical protein FFLO_02404 [Filobasidium floriforme]KAH8082688.1 hypothetical protein HD553DRAFT_324950 [Filobasidium floriforme]
MDEDFTYHQNPDGTSGYYQDATDQESLPSQNPWYLGHSTSAGLYGGTPGSTSGYQYFPGSVQTPYAWQSAPEQYLNPDTSSNTLLTESSIGLNALDLVRWEDMDKPSQERLLKWYSSKGIDKGDEHDFNLRTALKETLKREQQNVRLLDQNIHVRYCGESMKRGEVCQAVLVLPTEKRKSLTAETLQCRRCLHRERLALDRHSELPRSVPSNILGKPQAMLDQGDRKLTSEEKCVKPKIKKLRRARERLHHGQVKLWERHYDCYR